MIDFTPSPAKYSSHKEDCDQDEFQNLDELIDDFQETEQAELDDEQLQNQI